MRRSPPITRSGRVILLSCTILVLLVIALAASGAIYHLNREAIRSSDRYGHLLCGPGLHVDGVPVRGRARRMICRDQQGREVDGRPHLVAFLLVLPIVLSLSLPGLWFLARADIGERRARG